MPVLNYNSPDSCVPHSASRVYASVKFYQGILLANKKTKALTSRKFFLGSFSQTLFFGGVKRQPEVRLRSQATQSVISVVSHLLFIYLFHVFHTCLNK